MEEWKELEGFEGKYKVSSYGRVWNTHKDVEVSQPLSGDPQYKYVNLHFTGRKSQFLRTHIVVAKTFIDNPDNLPIVDHIDRDKMNNHVSNLRWTDHSGNQRNKEGSVYVRGLHLLDFVKKYESPYAAYQHILSRTGSGLSVEDAVISYEKYLEYGNKQTQIEWEGETVYLTDLCNRLEKDYDSVRSRLSQDWPLWNAINNIPEKHHYSFELKGKLVDHWFPTKQYLSDLHSINVDSLRWCMERNYTFEQIIAYDGKDHLRQTVQGVTGLVGELCKHFGKTESSVTTRMGKGMTLEEALLSPPERIKKVTIDGVSGSPKYWYEYFGLDYKTTKRKKDSLKCSFEDILKHFNVDLSGKSISYTD